MNEKNGFSLTHGGILVAVIGSAVAVFGLSQSCSSEVTTKLVEFAPVVVGGVMSWIGRMRATGPTTLGGFRKR